MPTGIRPRVNEAREFLEIAKDFKDPKEIIREALSNSWDAGASKVTLNFDLVQIPGTYRKKIIVTVNDDGEGMSSTKIGEINTSEIESFFNLGDSHKPYGSIGTKGHGTKIFYKSSGISVDTWKNGKHIHAETEMPPWQTLKKGIVPTYRYEEDTIDGKGTRIIVDGFEAKQTDFKFESLENLVQYILWYTVIGSFSQYFGSPKRMDVELKPANSPMPTPITIPFGFKFPNEDTDTSKGSNKYCKVFGPKTIECGKTQEGKPVILNIIGAILGEDNRELIPHTYEMMGLWLCKDYIRVERNNYITEEVFKGQYWYRNMLIFANCQQFDLTANRNNIRNDQEEYALAATSIKKFIEEIKNSPNTVSYFEVKKGEDFLKHATAEKEKEERKKEELKNNLEKRLNNYRGRPDLNAQSLINAPLKEPRSEAETSLLLQAMISCKHPGIDFKIGEYNTNVGTDLIIECLSKGIPTLAWAEIVITLENLFGWSHPPEGIHKVICWDLGRVKEKQSFSSGEEARLTKKGNGRYHLDIGNDTIEIYVLREILQNK
ncbi:MAG: ATP-binding protein [Dehalococcoidales bacterium]|nr:ATP-binding protein [Dehalococcoidales bacterium]